MVTMQDVARRAGVSLATVSRVINNPDLVSIEKKEKVRLAIQELGFSPSYFAHVLVTKKSGLLGVIVPDISYQYYSIMLGGIEDYASSKGFRILICNIEEKLDKELRYLQFFAEMRVDGIVLMHERSNATVENFLLTCGIPVVMASIRPKIFASIFSSVNIDDFKAAYSATELLIKKGRRKIALICGSLTDATSGEARFNGYKEALKANDIPFDKSIVRFGSFLIEQGEALANDIFSKAKPKPDAVFAAGDALAIGVLRVLKNRSLKVPEDVAIMGFDDLPFATICSPQLSTVRQPVRKIGIEAAQLLLSEIAHKPKTTQEKVLDFQLIEREST